MKLYHIILLEASTNDCYIITYYKYASYIFQPLAVVGVLTNNLCIRFKLVMTPTSAIAFSIVILLCAPIFQGFLPRDDGDSLILAVIKDRL